MLLGLSGDQSGDELDLSVVDGGGIDGGVASGALLTTFADAVHRGEVDDGLRATVAEAVGEALGCDAAAASCYHRRRLKSPHPPRRHCCHLNRHLH